MKKYRPLSNLSFISKILEKIVSCLLLDHIESNNQHRCLSRRSSVPGLGSLKESKMFLPHPRVKVSIVGSLRDREVACSASDRQGSNFESCVWRTVSSQSSHHPQEVLLAQFSLYVHKGGLKPDSFHFIFTGVFPDKLKIAEVISIHKTQLENCRPISILPAVSKVIERVIFDQMHDYFHTSKLYLEGQYGFKKKLH